MLRDSLVIMIIFLISTTTKQEALDQQPMGGGFTPMHRWWPHSTTAVADKDKGQSISGPRCNGDGPVTAQIWFVRQVQVVIENIFRSCGQLEKRDVWAIGFYECRDTGGWTPLPTGWDPFHNTLGSPSKVINFNDDCLRDNIANLKEKLTSFRNRAETSRGELMVGLYHEARVIVRKFLDGDVCVGLFTQLSFLSSSWPYIMWWSWNFLQFTPDLI